MAWQTAAAPAPTAAPAPVPAPVPAPAPAPAPVLSTPAAAWCQLMMQRRARLRDPLQVLPRAVVTLVLVVFSSVVGVLYGLQVPWTTEMLSAVAVAIVVLLLVLAIAAISGSAHHNIGDLRIKSAPRAVRTIRVLASTPSSRALAGLACSLFGLLCGIQLLVVVMALRGIYLGKMSPQLCACLVGYSVGFAVLGAFYGNLEAGTVSAAAFVAWASAAIAAGCCLLEK